MNIVDFSSNLKDITGKEVLDDKQEPVVLSNILCGMILNSRTMDFDALKLHGWAHQLYSNKKIKLDNSDLEVLRKFIKNNDTVTVLVSASLSERCLDINITKEE